MDTGAASLTPSLTYATRRPCAPAAQNAEAPCPIATMHRHCLQQRVEFIAQHQPRLTLRGSSVEVHTQAMPPAAHGWSEHALSALDTNICAICVTLALLEKS